MGQQNSISMKNLNKTPLDLQSIKDQYTFMAQGYHSKAYRHHRLDLVLKVMKKPYLDPILNQIKILDHLEPIWPDLCKYYLLSNNKMVGFTVKYFEGKKIDLILQEKQNIFYKNPQSRIRLVKKLKQIISRIQDLNICHGDIYYDNIIINQAHMNSENCQIFVIDFGNGFIFDQNTRTNAGLNGWKFMVPPQAKNGKKYDPKGVNAYQLGRVALQILLLESLEDYRNGKIEVDPEPQLKSLLQQGYDRSVKDQIQKYLSLDLDTRIKMLKQPSIMIQTLSEFK